MLQGVYDPVLPLDLVCGFREQFSRRLLAHDVLHAIAISNLICGIGLAKPELRHPLGQRGAVYNELRDGGHLFKVNRRLDLGDILGDVSLERLDINGLSHYSGHCEVCGAIGRVIKEEGKETF